MTHPEVIEGPYFIGVDGGGTHCRARLTSANGTVLGEAVGGSANTTAGTKKSIQEVIDTCDQATVTAGLTPAIYNRTYVGAGLAGLTVTTEKLRYVSCDHPFAAMASESDAYTACLGAHNGENGGIVISGTGSAAFAMINGVGYSIGGWGFLLGDDGSGAMLGLKVLRACIQVFDGMMPPSAMARDVLKKYDGDIHEMFAWARSATPKEFGTFAPYAFDWAEKGDTLAKRLISEAADAISRHIHAINTIGASRICLLGGMAPHIIPLLDENLSALIVPPKGDAEDGALIMARSLFDGTAEVNA